MFVRRIGFPVGRTLPTVVGMILVALVAPALASPIAASASAFASAHAPDARSIPAEMIEAEVSLEGGKGPAQGEPLSCGLNQVGVSAECVSGAAPVRGAGTDPPYPDPRWGSELTYDAADGYLLLFGATAGYEPTWSFADDSWSPISSTPAPPTRSWACMTYDWHDGYVVLFGGARGGIGTPTSELNDTWTFRGGSWSNITDRRAAPPALAYSSCTYDAAPGDGYVLLFGGATGVGPGHTGGSGLTVHSSEETWKFSGGKWTNLTNLSAPHPSARFGANMAYDPVDHYTILYGGAANGTSTANGSCSPRECPHFNDTWDFVGGAWTNISAQSSTNGTPPGRWEASFSNDSADGYDIIFGGQANGYKSLNATGNFTWAFAHGSWRNVTANSSVSPGTRFGAAMGFSPGTGMVVMYSGLSGTVNSPLRNDTWSFALGKWSCLWFAPSFSEVGLPTNTSWGVTLTPSAGSPITANSTSGAISLAVKNETYAYSISVVPGYHIKAGSYTGYVSATSSPVSVKWVLVTYAVAFAETGLPNGTAWSVTLTPAAGSPITQSSASATLVINTVNGSFSYSASASGYSSKPGTLTVSGSSPGTTTVTFEAVVSTSHELPFWDGVLAGAVVVGGLAAVLALWWRHRRRRGGDVAPRPPQ